MSVETTANDGHNNTNEPTTEFKSNDKSQAQVSPIEKLPKLSLISTFWFDNSKQGNNAMQLDMLARKCMDFVKRCNTEIK